MQQAAYNDRRILQRALALSVLLHAALLAVSGTAPSPTTDPDTPIDLKLWIEDPGDATREFHEVAETARATGPPEPPGPKVPAPSSAAASVPTPAPIDGPQEPEQTETEPETPLDRFANALVVDDAMPSVADESPAPATMPQAEEAMLADRLTDWSQDFLDPKKIAEPQRWRRKGQTYEARIERRVTAEPMGFERVEVVIATQREGQKLETRMQMRRLAFSHFTQLIDFWDPTMRLNDDEIHGRFHSNTEIQLGWTRDVAPRFFGQVTTAAQSYKVTTGAYPRRRNEIFAGGIDLNTAAVRLPRPQPPLGDSAAERAAQRRFFERDTLIVFYGDGSYGWQAAGGGAEQRESIGSEALYLLARPGVRLQVRGKVRGAVLVYSPEAIEIVGNLVYARDVRHSVEANDYLGLASDRDILIPDVDRIGAGDVTIEAALYARRRFAVDGLTAPYSATLAIFGSLSAGSLTATEPRYATRVEFDRRFERQRPPGFPLTDRYELEQWDRRWTPIQ